MPQILYQIPSIFKEVFGDHSYEVCVRGEVEIIALMYTGLLDAPEFQCTNLCP